MEMFSIMLGACFGVRAVLKLRQIGRFENAVFFGWVFSAKASSSTAGTDTGTGAPASTMVMVDNRKSLARGWHIGAGPTEVMCKNVTLRLKRPGMKWDADHAAGVRNLIALKESGQWAAYWQTRKAG